MAPDSQFPNASPAEPDDVRLADVLRSVEGDALPPDMAALDALRQKSEALFAAAGTDQPLTGMVITPAASFVSPDRTKSSTSTKPRPTMAVLALRGVAALVAAVSLISAWFVSVPDKPARADVPFSKVLQELRSVDSLRMRLVKGQQSVDVWMRRPGFVRIEQSPQRYEIAAGSRLWKIDQGTNTVTEHDSRLFANPEQQIDLLALLEVGVTDASNLLRAQPRKRASYAGHDCHVYESLVETAEGQLRIVAYADARTLQLTGIVAWPADAQVAAAGVPLAELQLVAVNPPIADEKFEVVKSLSTDGRIGKVSAAQGIVLLRPMVARRWTPVNRGLLVQPGDWIKADLRGGNAVKVSLTSGYEITVGPGALIELMSPTQARLHSGTAQVSRPTEKKGVDIATTFELLAPRNGSRKFQGVGKHLVRVDREEQLVDVAQTPVWLAGFEGTSSNESLGSLIVQIDGRNEPLTVGYHKVNVEIRDQIARTTIEESFVNHTAGRLEGIFHFPLPQDASISGFGMWIGNDLVEADVVEKQRAREIYETILREKRDPGLLEWTGGNIFKARVFPIEAHSEKRVKIVYTQVLPLRANRYRYSYGLRSEMLRTRPLRELSLTVTVNSALGLKEITCPTHEARIQKTEHSGQVEFTAQEYTPDRDFEVVCETDIRQSDVVVVPHRRGDDGYFLMQLSPPGIEGNWQRQLLSDGAPLKLVLLCDTSSSMDSEKRKQQREFVTTVLSTLGPNDRFQVVTADVKTNWAHSQPVAATPESIANVQKSLEERVSLGWTDLGRAFTDVVNRAPADATVIYIGDGIVTAGQTDPHSFVKSLRRLVLGDPDKKPTQTRQFHAVTVGNSFEPAIVKGIAGLAGGSVRSIGGEQTPQAVALELLNELAQPGLRDVQLEFRGLKVAAVYPETLPNIPAGTQQILVGRYLPEGKDQQGEVIVTAMRGGEKVRYAAKVRLKDAEEGNSFIPRLWARGHLEQLLQQGQSAAIRDQVIALSEEFHIMTPYTSLLVLESDADRDRFGVKRRYEMRDGERFFAEGRGNANFELLQQQMKRAGDWRIGMRRRVLRSLAGLGRNPGMFSQRQYLLSNSELQLQRGAWSGSGNGRSSGLYRSDWDYNAPSTRDAATRVLNGMVEPLELGLPMDEASAEEGGKLSERLSELSLGDRAAQGGENSKQLREEFGWEGPEEEVLKAGIKDNFRGKKRELAERKSKADLGESEWGASDGIDFDAMPGGYANDREDLIAESSDKLFISDFRPNGKSLGAGGPAAFERRYYAGIYNYPPDYTSWLNSLFPSLSGPEKAPPAALKDPDTWTAEALALSKSLARTETLLKLEGGLNFKREIQSFDPRWNRRTTRNTDVAVYSTAGWLTRTENVGSQNFVHFCDGDECGVFSLAFLLGRNRPAVPQDLKSIPPTIEGQHPLHLGYRGFRARVEPAGDQKSLLVLTNPDKTYELRILVDTNRHVQLKVETWQNGKLTSTTNYKDFVQVAGLWWARKVINQDDNARTVSETTQIVEPLTGNQYKERMKAELAAKPQVQFLSLTHVSLSDARRKVADGSANVDDRITVLMHFAQLQQWDDVLKQIDAIEKLATDKPGIRWVRTMALQTMRRNEEARQRLLNEVHQLAARGKPEDWFLAEFCLTQASSVSGQPELLEILQLAKPVYSRQSKLFEAMTRWDTRLASTYEGLGRTEEALTLRKSLAERAPWEVSLQVDLAQRLQRAGRGEEAQTWLQQQIDRNIERPTYESDTLHNGMAELLRAKGDWEKLTKFTKAWMARNPDSTDAYGQHFSALFFNDQVAAAYSLADEYIKASRIPGKLDPVVRARVNAALNLALGSIPHLYFQRLDDRWCGPLAETARFFLKHPHHFDIAQRIIGDYRFQQGDMGDRLRAEAFMLLQTDLSRFTPGQIGSLLGWTLSGRMEFPEPINGRKQLESSELPIALWEKIAQALHARWSDTADKDEKNQLGQSLLTLYTSRFHDSKLLPFLRERLANAPKEFRPQYISALFEDLLRRPWSTDIENECFATLRELAPGEDSTERLISQLPALMRLVDSLIGRREVRDEKQWRDKGGLDQLTRQQIAEKKREFAKAARANVAARLLTEGKDESNAVLAAWIRMERVWIDVRAGLRPTESVDECWRVLGTAPAKPLSDGAWSKLNPQEQRQIVLNDLVKTRAWTTLQYFAARRNAPRALVERVRKYIDAGLAFEGDAAKPWRMAKFRFLIALDLADELEKELHNWIRTDAPTAPWRMMLARLVAERGKIPEAIELFESADKHQLLSASDLRQLADWYLVSNRRPDYERSRVAAYKLLPEHQLSNMLYRVRYRWYATNIPLPSQLDEDTLFAYRALLEKSANPQSYLYQLRDLYTACRDFRLLQMIPDAILGRSPQQVYPFLEMLSSQVLYEIRNEATADEIVARIEKLRTGDRTLTDLRALDLLEASIERKSSEVLNQPGPHVEKCLAALKRAFERKWQEGEPVLMAHFLHHLGRLPHATLVDEQLRELRSLQGMTQAGSRDHLVITLRRCQLLFQSYGRREEAVQEMELEVAAYDGAHAGLWPYEDNETLGQYVGMLENLGRFTDGENVLLKYQQRSTQSAQLQWMRNRLLSLYNSALAADGEVSLGKRSTLFLALMRRFLADVEAAPDENVRHQLVSQVTNTLHTAHNRSLPETFEETRKFVFTTLPGILRRQQSQYRNTASQPMYTLKTILGSKLALQYVVERMEQYPQRFDYTYENAWNTFGHQLGEYRYAVATEKLAWQDLEPRVLALTLQELRRELRTGERRSYVLYHRHHSYYWAEKTDDFVRVSNEVYEEQSGSGRLAVRVAQYLWDGVDRKDRAIAIMLASHLKGILTDSNIGQLVDWLQHENRYAESIPLLEPLIRAYPDVIGHRTRLMAAYFHTEKPLQELVQKIEKHFHAGGRWTEANISALAQACLNCQLTQKAVDYFKEAISLHKRTHPFQRGDSWLSSMNQQLARAYSTLGDTVLAVDAASEAIVVWGPTHYQRNHALQTLSRVLGESKNLPAYQQHLDQQAARNGTDSPLLRKEVGKVYQSQNRNLEASVQFELAIALQPNDRETLQALIAVYDKLGRREAATKQLLRQIDFDRNNLALYQQLADRLKDNEAEAERAATSLIEAAPNETENQTAFAELRQRQGRWAEAIPHWERVAELRRLEPTGLLKLAEAQIHEKRWDDARRSLDTLSKTSWPGRFNEVSSQVQRLQQQLPR